MAKGMPKHGSDPIHLLLTEKGQAIAYLTKMIRADDDEEMVLALGRLTLADLKALHRYIAQLITSVSPDDESA